eukprot:CAMPEP_0206018834 /NCGR_PEP_ID=MMETSP1464-20131121/27939_1 /ASSEMBLY_ACC=CAM_ASM_001124 /TAXON_ID=119497 /ORGANISM="Exanthemachrysis gayraliae, Strain RCC1523" /LENGTH=119 /DNA_ID=CAMNT_0053392723 /DNA_START=18 /DNA_END=372 /DNA_ORIENTATION=+
MSATRTQSAAAPSAGRPFAGAAALLAVASLPSTLAASSSAGASASASGSGSSSWPHSSVSAKDTAAVADGYELVGAVQEAEGDTLALLAAPGGVQVLGDAPQLVPGEAIGHGHAAGPVG